MRRTLAILTLLLILATVTAPAGSGRQNAQPPAQDLRAVPFPEFVTPPIFESMQVLAPDGASHDDFGSAVASRGTTLFVGALGARNSSGSYVGAVYVLDHAGGDWVVQARLMPGDGVAYGDFGSALAIDGNTLVVGAPEVQVGTNYNQGAAYVFEESGGQWVQTARLTAPDGASYDYFGESVAVSGTTVVVGAPGASVGGNYDQGAAYVFSKSGTAWAFDAKLLIDDGAANDEFGHAVAISGDVAVVGAPQAGISSAGTVRAFAKGSEGWLQEAEFAPATVADRLGQALVFSGDTLLVGAPGANNHDGAVFQYTRTEGAWLEEALITGSGSAGGDFGAGIARYGDLLLVGAPYASVPAGGGFGAGHLFRLVGGTWVEQSLLATSTFAYPLFGRIAMVGDEVVAGYPDADVGTHDRQGALYWWGMAPLVQAVTPRIAPTAGGTTVTITGRYLMPGATVTIGGAQATNPTPIDPQTLTVVTPSRPSGPADIVVTNADGRSDTLTSGLTFGDTDLTITAVRAPAAIGQDVPVLVRATTKNVGKHKTVTTITRFFLSSDSVLDANDRVLASHKAPALAAGRTYTAWSSVTIPRSVAAGQYFLFAVADVTGVVGETNEANNTRMVRVKVGCDVTISNFAAPAKARAGEGFTATVTTANLGPGPAARSTTRLYLSPDSTKGGNDTRLGERFIGTLNAGSASVWRGAFAIPDTVAAGSYFLIAAADDAYELAEFGRDNNTRVKPITILPAITRPVRR